MLTYSALSFVVVKQWTLTFMISLLSCAQKVQTKYIKVHEQKDQEDYHDIVK